jgi:hypothetical protein
MVDGLLRREGMTMNNDLASPFSARRGLEPAVTAAHVPLSTLERLAFFGLVAQLVFTLVIVPVSPFGRIVEPIYLATVSSSAITVVLMTLRLRTRRDVRVEKLLLAMFLGAMPVIYSLTAVRNGASVDVLALEISAIVVFGALAVVGFNGSPWFLVIGIAGHGLLWDGSHHAAHLVVPGWYAVFCLVVDVMLAAYVATQIRAYSTSRSRGRSRTS